MALNNYDLPIESIVIDDAQRASSWQVFVNDQVTEIKAYRESDGTLWFAVKNGDQVYQRINGRFVVEVNHVR